jgi:NADH-quinone oxidoreductase subunit K
MITLTHYLMLTGILFSMSLSGIFLNRKNMIVLLMCVELMLLAVNTNLIAFAYYRHSLLPHIFVFFILTVAAAEAAVGLSLIILIFRKFKTIDIDAINTLKG